MATLWFKGKGGKLSRVWAVAEYRTYPPDHYWSTARPQETRWARILLSSFELPLIKRRWTLQPLSRLVVMDDDSQQETYDSQPGERPQSL